MRKELSREALAAELDMGMYPAATLKTNKLSVRFKGFASFMCSTSLVLQVRTILVTTFGGWNAKRIGYTMICAAIVQSLLRTRRHRRLAPTYVHYQSDA